MKAIALLEVQALVAAITGLDAMAKAADVKLIHVEKRLGGRLVTIVVEGEVSAVRAALEAGAAAAAEEYGFGYDLCKGANLAGFKKIAEAMMAQGIV